jgi:hypothetical protein
MQLNAPERRLPTQRPNFVRHVRLRFTRCVRATVTTALSPRIWRESLDDRLIDFDAARGLAGHIWGVKWQNIHPGITLVTDSRDAATWSTALGIPFHEARIETNVHDLSLVFADLNVETVEPGYAPFVVRNGGPDLKTRTA